MKITSEKQGIQETLELCEFLWKIYTGIHKTATDENLKWWEKIGNFVPAMMAAPTGLTGARYIPQEWEDVDDNEKKQLMDLAKKYFVLPDNELELLILETIDLAISLGSNALKWVGRSKANEAK